MMDSTKSAELFIQLVTGGQFRKNPKAPSRHKKRSLTKYQFEDSVLNSFIGFLSESAFEDHFESVHDEGILLDGGWFIPSNYRSTPLDPSGAYLTITCKPKERLEAFYRDLARHYGGALYVFEKNPSFRTDSIDSSNLKTLELDDIFNVFEFRDESFISRRAGSLFSRFKPIPDHKKAERMETMQVELNEDLQKHILSYQNASLKYCADHETSFLDRLVIDHFFLPSRYKGSIMDVDFVLDWDGKYDLVDVKAKTPSEDDAYGINEHKLFSASEIDSWPGFSRKYVVNKENISEEPNEIQLHNWLIADFRTFATKGKRTEGRSGRGAEDSEPTFELTIEGNFSKFL